MRYQTILVHVDDAPSAPARFCHAIALAQRCDAHLIGLAASGIARSLYSTLPPEKNDPTLALHLGYLREHAHSGIVRFSQACEAAGLASYAAQMVDDEVAAGIILQSRAVDLTVLSQAAPDDDASEDLPAHVVLQAGGPVLVLPYALARAAAAPQHVLVAWDASREAARALQAALPLLALASQVSVATFDTNPPSTVSMDARRADPLPWLARHGIKAELVSRAVEAPRLSLTQRRHPIGEALLSLIGESGADLLVMGAYAHSRVRELLLGGVTRTIFNSMTVPVLMAH